VLCRLPAAPATALATALHERLRAVAESTPGRSNGGGDGDGDGDDDDDDDDDDEKSDADDCGVYFAKNMEEREQMLIEAAEHVKMAREQRKLYQQKVADAVEDAKVGRHHNERR